MPPPIKLGLCCSLAFLRLTFSFLSPKPGMLKEQGEGEGTNYGARDFPPVIYLTACFDKQLVPVSH